MERKEQFPGQGKGPVKRSVFDQPRKVVSGMVYSGAIIGMLVISLAFSVTVAVLSKTLGMTVDEISQTDVYKYFSYLLYQIVYIAVILAFAFIYRSKPAAFGWRKASHPRRCAPHRRPAPLRRSGRRGISGRWHRRSSWFQAHIKK